MDWSFLNIFKNAEFNTLMLAAAATCWVLYSYYPYNEWYLGVALLCTIYCIVRLIVYIYKLLSARAQARWDRDYKNKLDEEKALDKKQQAQYAFDRIGAETQSLLKRVVESGKKSSYSDVYILRNNVDTSMMIQKLRCYLYNDGLIGNWISIDENPDSYCVYIKYPLNVIIEDRINK